MNQQGPKLRLSRLSRRLLSSRCYTVVFTTELRLRPAIETAADRAGTMRSFLAAYADIYGLSPAQAESLELDDRRGDRATGQLSPRRVGVPAGDAHLPFATCRCHGVRERQDRRDAGDRGL